MNILWTSIIIFCFIFAIFTDNLNFLFNSLFTVPERSLKLLVSLGSLIIIYNGIFQIAIDCKLIRKISFIFKPILKVIYNISDGDVLELLCANFTANFLGLGSASTPISLKVLNLTTDKKIINKLICLNVSCFSILPFTIITLRNKFSGTNNFKVWILIVLITMITSIFSIFICNIGDKQ